jgi:hypothetical protein
MAKEEPFINKSEVKKIRNFGDIGTKDVLHEQTVNCTVN